MDTLGCILGVWLVCYVTLMAAARWWGRRPHDRRSR